MHACPLRGVYGTRSFGFVRGPEWCVHVCHVSGCGYGGAPMRGPGFVCRVGGFGPCCLPPSRFETCCRGRVYRAGPLLAADLIWRSCCGRVCGAGLVLSDDLIRWSCCKRAYGADLTLSANLIRWSCCERAYGADLALSADLIRWSCCGRAYSADLALSADLIRWSCCGRSYGAGSFLAAALIRWSCCGRSYGAGPFLAVALMRRSASAKVSLTSAGRPGLWWSATGRRGCCRRRWPHGAWLVSMACYLDFLVRQGCRPPNRGEYNKSDEKINK